MPREMPVRDVMTTEVVAFSPDETVQDASARMVDAGVDAGPVVDGDGRVVGMLSSTDLIVRESRWHIPTVISILGATLEWPSDKKRFDEDVEKTLGGHVADVMHERVYTCSPDDTVETAATLMHDHEVSRLPVLDGDGRLVGIVARGDILRAIVRDAQASQ
jgi:CBS domain-containing protein